MSSPIQPIIVMVSSGKMQTAKGAGQSGATATGISTWAGGGSSRHGGRGFSTCTSRVRQQPLDAKASSTAVYVRIFRVTDNSLPGSALGGNRSSQRLNFALEREHFLVLCKGGCARTIGECVALRVCGGESARQVHERHPGRSEEQAEDDRGAIHTVPSLL